MRPLPEELLDELTELLDELDLELLEELEDELDFELLEELEDELEELDLELLEEELDELDLEDELDELEELEELIALPATRIVQAVPLIVQLPSLEESKVPLAVKPKLAVLPTAMLPLLDALVKV